MRRKGRRSYFFAAGVSKNRHSRHALGASGFERANSAANKAPLDVQGPGTRGALILARRGTREALGLARPGTREALILARPKTREALILAGDGLHYLHNSLTFIFLENSLWYWPAASINHNSLRFTDSFFWKILRPPKTARCALSCLESW